MIPGRTFEPKDTLNVLRRWPAIVIPGVIVAAVGMLVVHRLPDRYRSETVIMVVPQRVPDSYVHSTVTTRIEDRLRSLNQQLVSRVNLDELIKELDLYPALTRAGDMEGALDRMRRDIDTEITRSDTFKIAYVAPDAATALKVTERLAQMYTEQSVRDREALADSTNQFLDTQLVDARQRLLAHEKKLEAYKTRFTGRLPAQVQSNLQVMQNAQLQIQALVDSLNRDRDRQLLLQGQLDDLRGAPVASDAAAPPDAVTPAASELAAARKTLDELSVRLHDVHPDVVRQKKIVNDLEARVAEESHAQSRQLPARRRLPTTDPHEASRLARVDQISTELDSLRFQISEKQNEEARLRAVVGDYQERVESAPTREAELTELMRDYDTLHQSYTGLLAKKEEAQVSANLERHNVGEQFRVLDPPRLPERPFKPNRPLLDAAAAAGGLGVGLLLAGFLEYRDTSIKTDQDVVATLALPVLALIPELKASSHDASLSLVPWRRKADADSRTPAEPRR